MQVTAKDTIGNTISFDVAHWKINPRIAYANAAIDPHALINAVHPSSADEEKPLDAIIIPPPEGLNIPIITTEQIEEIRNVNIAVNKGQLTQELLALIPEHQDDTLKGVFETAANLFWAKFSITAQAVSMRDEIVVADKALGLPRFLYKDSVESPLSATQITLSIQGNPMDILTQILTPEEIKELEEIDKKYDQRTRSESDPEHYIPKKFKNSLHSIPPGAIVIAGPNVFRTHPMQTMDAYEPLALMW